MDFGHILTGELASAHNDISGFIDRCFGNFETRLETEIERHYAATTNGLKAENEAVREQLRGMREEFEAKQYAYTNILAAHDKLLARTRRMRSWINWADKWIMAAKKKYPDLAKCDSLGDSHSKDANSTGEELAVTLSKTADKQPLPEAYTRSSGLMDGADSINVRSASCPREQVLELEEHQASTSSNKGQSQIPSDPATESTESASAPPSQDQLGTETPAQADLDEDFPEIIFERSLKRKRSARKEPYVKPEPTTPEGERSQPAPATLDLDEVSLPLASGRGEHLSPLSRDPVEKRRCASEGTQQPARTLAGDCGKPDMGLSTEGPRPIRQDHSIWEPRIFEDPGEIEVTSIQSVRRSRNNQLRAKNLPSYQSRPALLPKTPNPRAPPLQSNFVSASGEGDSARRDMRINFFSEDGFGEEHQDLLDPGVSSGKIEKLLSSKSGTAVPLIAPRPQLRPRSDIAQAPRSPGSGRQAARPPLMERQVQTPTASSFKRQVETPAASTFRGPAPATEPRAPLRREKLENLSLDDFRINPARNDGEDFAYSEVVRNKAQRKCLPGCTNPECCGATFSRAAEIGGFLPPSRSSLSDALRGHESSKQSEEERLLRNYLGDGASRLAHMSNPQRADLLAKAKAAAMAQFHGKHRHLHPRPPSPVGFWSTEMPSTQEVCENSKKALEQERQTVHDRHREAIRPNGRWLFRDEVTAARR